MQGEADLLQVVAALHAVGRLAHLLDRRQQQADEDGDDRYHDQQLDQREGPPTAAA
jgi:hypothetical protein